MLPRAIRQTLPATPASSTSPVPKLYSAALAEPSGEPSIGAAAKLPPPTLSVASRLLPVGTVDSVATPGPAISTSALNCEKSALALLMSMAATDITLG